MRQQHLDFYGIEYGVMNPLSPSGQGEQNDEYSAALAFACNEFQLNHWNALDPRLKCSLVVPYEDPEASRKEIRRRCRRPPLRPRADAHAHQRADGPPPLLADL